MALRGALLAAGRCLPKAAAVWDGDVNTRMYHIFVNYLCFFLNHLLVQIDETSLVLPKTVNIYLFVHTVNASPRERCL